MIYQIDDGVPIPIKRGMIPLDQLEVDQSIAFPKSLREKVQVKASILKRKEGKVFTVRSLSKDTCRVWRVS